ncbi:MAG: hypothetical protein J7M18_04690 [Candidatus Eremiobacteraeota bacterium]|nr:hypothetical protein [Candidatus Eremiobacteraeota bacterium]
MPFKKITLTGMALLLIIVVFSLSCSESVSWNELVYRGNKHLKNGDYQKRNLLSNRR